jgi:hypothetical protein
MRWYPAFCLALGLNLLSFSSEAQQHSYSGVTAENIGEEQEACASDAARFCGGNVMALFEMEICLSRYTRQLSPACRDQIAPTDFRKYHEEAENLFE